ncbi:hypothetical protein pb186bvf_003150 [Paramecium bursaria]
MILHILFNICLTLLDIFSRLDYQKKFQCILALYVVKQSTSLILNNLAKFNIVLKIYILININHLFQTQVNSPPSQQNEFQCLQLIPPHNLKSYLLKFNNMFHFFVPYTKHNNQQKQKLNQFYLVHSFKDIKMIIDQNPLC